MIRSTWLAVGLAVLSGPAWACEEGLIDTPGWTLTAWHVDESRLSITVVWRGQTPARSFDGVITVREVDGADLGAFEFAHSAPILPDYSVRIEGKFFDETVAALKPLSSGDFEMVGCVSRVTWVDGSEQVFQ